MRRLLPAFALILAVSAAPVARAGGEVVFDPAALEACWAEHESARSCAGQGSGPCMEATPYGASNRGMTECMAAELAWWRVLMARLLDDLRAAEAGFDAEPPGPDVHNPPSARAGLERTHALWEAWKAARCNYEVIELLGSTLLGPMSVGCRLELTHAQVDFLVSRLQGHAAR